MSVSVFRNHDGSLRPPLAWRISALRNDSLACRAPTWTLPRRTANGQRVVAAAESVDHMPLVVGVDVVIDRLEAGVVYVEPWSRVEQRL